MKLDIRKINNLNTIISSYENKTLEDKSLSSASSIGYKNLVQLENNLDQLEANQKSRKALNSQLNGENEFASLGDMTDKLNESIKNTGNSIKDINSQLETGINLPIDFIEKEINKIDLGPLKDCLPCSLRGKGDLFDFNLNFQIKEYLESLLNTIKALANIVLPKINLGKGTDICVMLNTINFKCLPDKVSLSFMLTKSLDIKLKVPEFTLPSLSDIVVFLISPLYLGFSFSAETWLKLVLDPIDCLISSLDNQIKAIESSVQNSSINVSADFLINAQTSLSKKQENPKKLSIGIKESGKSLNALESIKQASNLTLSLKSIRDKVKKEADQLKVHFKSNFFDKSNSIMKNQLKGLDDFVKSLNDIKEITEFINLIETIYSAVQISQVKCKNKDDEIEEIEKIINDELEKVFPGNIKEKSFEEVREGTSISDKQEDLSQLSLTDKEINALELGEFFIKPLTEEKSLEQGVGFFSPKKEQIKIKDCVQIDKSSFYDTKILESSFM